MQTQGKILIVEDESSISDTISYALRTEGYSSHCCNTAAQALREFTAVDPALIILDVGLPDGSGFELCKNIRTSSTVPVLFLTARANEMDRVLGLELGGDDYMVKPFSPRELVARVRAILRRSAGDEPAGKSGTKDFIIDDTACRITFRNKPLELSRYEFRLLALLIRRPGRVFSREELMNRVWESPEMSLERTVDTHVKTIRSKLRAIDADDDSIVTHRGFGYSLRSDA